MLSQQDQEMRRNVPDPLFAGGSHFCGSGAGDETSYIPAGLFMRYIFARLPWQRGICCIKGYYLSTA